MLIQGISAIFIDQIIIYLVSKKEHFMLAKKNFQQFTTESDNPQEWQGKIQSSLKKILRHTSLYYVVDIFCIKIIYNTAL